MPQNKKFLQTHDLVNKKQKNEAKTLFFSTLHPLSTVIFATATVLAFVLLHNCRFNFHCYTQREPAPTQKSARTEWPLRPYATSCAKDYEEHSDMETSFAEPPNTLQADIMIRIQLPYLCHPSCNTKTFGERFLIFYIFFYAGAPARNKSEGRLSK